MKRKEFEEAVFASNLNSSARIVALAYAYHLRYDATPGTGVFPAQATVAKNWGLNKNTVGLYFKALVEAGWFVIIGRAGEFKRTAVVRLEVGQETEVLTKRRRGRDLGNPND